LFFPPCPLLLFFHFSSFISFFLSLSLSLFLSKTNKQTNKQKIRQDVLIVFCWWWRKKKKKQEEKEKMSSSSSLDFSDFHAWLQQKREQKVSLLPWVRTLLNNETVME